MSHSEIEIVTRWSNNDTKERRETIAKEIVNVLELVEHEDNKFIDEFESKSWVSDDLCDVRIALRTVGDDLCLDLIHLKEDLYDDVHHIISQTAISAIDYIVKLKCLPIYHQGTLVLTFYNGGCAGASETSFY